MRLRSSSGWDWWLFLAAAALTSIGALAMASATATLNPALAVRHAQWIAAGVALSVAVGRLDSRRFAGVGPVIYGASVLGLVLVPLAGVARLGAARWLSVFGLSLQPSEPAKLAVVWMLAHHLAGHGRPLPARAVWTSAVLVGLPMLLVFLQPDLGSASVFGAIWLGMIWIAGASRGALMTLGGALLALAPIGWQTLKAYQRDRLLAFVNPRADQGEGGGGAEQPPVPTG